MHVESAESWILRQVSCHMAVPEVGVLREVFIESQLFETGLVPYGGS